MKPLLLVLSLALGGHTLAAHEIEDNRASLVLRDRAHFTLTLFLAYPEALHRALAPESPFQEFLLACSAMSPGDLQQRMARAHAAFESATRLHLPQGEFAFVNWKWPSAVEVQTLLRRRVMRAVVDSEAHAHEPPLEVHAELLADREITSVRLQLPPQFQKVLVVASRPRQHWLESGAVSPPITF